MDTYSYSAQPTQRSTAVTVIVLPPSVERVRLYQRETKIILTSNSYLLAADGVVVWIGTGVAIKPVVQEHGNSADHVRVGISTTTSPESNIVETNEKAIRG